MVGASKRLRLVLLVALEHLVTTFAANRIRPTLEEHLVHVVDGGLEARLLDLTRLEVMLSDGLKTLLPIRFDGSQFGLFLGAHFDGG